MRRLLILALGAMLVIGVQFLANCSSPLGTTELNDPIDPTPPGGKDTIYLVDTLTMFDTVFTFDTVMTGDTIFSIDTVIIVDSLGQVDTILITDTLTFIDTTIWVDTLIVVDTFTNIDTVYWTDTVIVIDTVMIPDTSGSPVMCAQLSSSQQQIVWAFSNPSGLFDLTFVAITDRDKPVTVLTVKIDDDIFEWDLSENLIFSMERDLTEPTTFIQITTKKPPARGHAVSVCLTVAEQ